MLLFAYTFKEGNHGHAGTALFMGWGGDGGGGGACCLQGVNAFSDPHLQGSSLTGTKTVVSFLSSFYVKIFL